MIIFFETARARMSLRYNLEAWNLPLELEEMILRNLSSQLIHHARTDLLHMKLMAELRAFYHYDIDIDNLIFRQITIDEFRLNVQDASIYSISLDNLPPSITSLG